MINKGTRIKSGQKPHLRLLDLTFDNGVSKTDKEPKPHGGLRGMSYILPQSGILISTIPRQIYENNLVVDVNYSIKQMLFPVNVYSSVRMF